MLKLIKYLKKSVIPIIFIIILLIIQAFTDLSLPQYTSKIINVGIQQGGIENIVPIVIRESTFDKILLFIDEEEQLILKNSYIKLEKELLTSEGYNKYLKKYPLIKKENIYKLKSINKDNLQKLNSLLLKPILLINGINSNNELKEKILKYLNNNEKTDIFTIIELLPSEQKQLIIKELDKNIGNLPESILEQMAIEFIKREYEIISVNVNEMQIRYILTTGLIMLLISLGSAGAAILISLIGSRVAAKIAQNLRHKVFTKVISFSEAEFKKFSTSSLITRTTNDIQHIQMVIVMILRNVIYAPIMGIGGIIKVLHTDVSMTWVIGLGVFIISLIVFLLFLVAFPKFKLIQKLIDRLNLVSREILSGIPVIRAFSTEKYEEKRFDKANIDLMKIQLFVNRTMGLMMPLMTFIMSGISLLIVWVGAHNIDSGTIQVGDMMAFLQYAMQIMMAFLMISIVSIMIPRASVSMGRIDEVLRTKNVINDPEIPETFDKTKRGYIEFKNVSFCYPDADENVLTDINFVARSGEITAFIGSTGSGKSTIINLIPRFYDVTSGEILIDGVDIRKVNLQELRSKIGYVPQKGILFSGTIESNIKFGNKKITDKEMQKAAEIAQAKEFIMRKKEKFDYKIAQGGTNVSGGQKQRLSIARAVAKNPDIFIFDDSFSALDFKTDATLRTALKKELKNKTVIIVTQRISNVLHADQIIVLENGKIVGKGKHTEILKNCQVYREIASSQLSKEELSNA
ncbi:MAG: ABC transporter ATP-binding protein [Mollicutes bacterium]|nr:ABC transporter ATP-binding protein [Mollicutes bacterium]